MVTNVFLLFLISLDPCSEFIIHLRVFTDSHFVQMTSERKIEISPFVHRSCGATKEKKEECATADLGINLITKVGFEPFMC